MSWFHSSTTAVDARNHASAAEIVACFRDETKVLNRLAFLITASSLNHPNIVTIYELGEVDGAHYIAMELVSGETLRKLLAGGPIAFQKVATIAAALSHQGKAIRMYEVMYKDRRCSHGEHLCQLDDERRADSLALILEMDAQRIIAELDPLCRAILVLRIAIRSSIQDCSLRLNVSRAVLLAANCLAMTWLDYHHMKPLEDGHSILHSL